MKFSEIEKIHILKAWLSLSFAFAVLNVGLFSPSFMLYFIISMLTAGLGFLAHELSHKYTAQKLGCWAEFRADDRMLFLAILSSFFGFIFAAPGAVYIFGKASNKKTGIISLAGPLSNIVLAIAFLPLALYLASIKTAFFKILAASAFYGYRINSYIAIFNMMPIMNFDGKKIYKWNKLAYFSAFFISLLIAVLPV